MHKPTLASPRFTSCLVTLGILLLMQTVYMFLPDEWLMPFNRVCRPAVYISICAVLFAFFSRDERPVLKKRQSILIAGLISMFYFAAVLILGMIFGFGKNAMASGVSIVIELIWMQVPMLAASEYLRIKLIKSASKNKRTLTAVLIVIIFTFVQLNVLKSFPNLSSDGKIDFVFVNIIPVLALNSVLAYMAVESSLPVLLIIRYTFTLTPLILPIVPNSPNIIWSVVMSVILFVSVIAYHFIIKSQNERIRRLIKRRSKYVKSSFLPYFIPATLLTFFIIFNFRIFTYFPVTVLTGSMTGTHDLGSVVIVEKIRPEDVHAAVNEGDIILFKKGNAEVIHRVIEFQYNNEGERIYITQGDANPVPDVSPVEKEQILGISRGYIKYIGYPFVFIKRIKI